MYDAIYQVINIDYFIKRDIKIKDIFCGWCFSVMIDYQDKVWRFGDNRYGQLGGLEDEFVCQPTEMEIFSGCKIDMVRCGVAHCYLRCDGNKHYLWGDNDWNECLMLMKVLKNY